MTHSSIREKAAQWLIELDTSDNVEDRWPDFEAWLNENPEHRAAFVSLEQAWSAVEDLKAFHVNEGTLRTDPLFSQEPKAALLRRPWKSGRVVTSAFVLAALAYALSVTPPAKWTQPPVAAAAAWKTYSTDYGEQKLAPLADGSVVELNTNTQVRVNFTAARREAVLEQGEVLLTVKHDPQRPFLVTAGSARVRALGTTFSVWRKSDDETVTLVKEGRVQVTAPAHPALEVPAQHTATASSRGVQVDAIEPARMNRKLSWRNGQLAFKGETLDEVVAEFNRYNLTKLKIDDPDIARQRIGGTFSSRDPTGFAELLEHTFGIRHVLEGPDGSQPQVIHLSGAIQSARQ
jgi:transmembrane sensor